MGMRSGHRDIIDNSLILTIGTWLLPSGILHPIMLSYFLLVAKILSNTWCVHWPHKVVDILDRVRVRLGAS